MVFLRLERHKLCHFSGKLLNFRWANVHQCTQSYGAKFFRIVFSNPLLHKRLESVQRTEEHIVAALLGKPSVLNADQSREQYTTFPNEYLPGGQRRARCAKQIQMISSTSLPIWSVSPTCHTRRPTFARLLCAGSLFQLNRIWFLSRPDRSSAMATSTVPEVVLSNLSY